MAVPVGQDKTEFNGAIKLNESGAMILRLLQDGENADTIAASLVNRYGIDRSLSQKATQRVIDVLRQKSLLLE